MPTHARHRKRLASLATAACGGWALRHGGCCSAVLGKASDAKAGPASSPNAPANAATEKTKALISSLLDATSHATRLAEEERVEENLEVMDAKNGFVTDVFEEPTAELVAGLNDDVRCVHE